MANTAAQLPVLTVGSLVCFPSVFFESLLFSGARREVCQAQLCTPPTGGVSLNKHVQSAHVLFWVEPVVIS